jgi:hypothetical protein
MRATEAGLETRPPRSICVYCGGPARATLCGTCRLGLEKYTDQNPPIVAAYVWRGIAEFEVSLGNHAAFDEWVARHPERA